MVQTFSERLKLAMEKAEIKSLLELSKRSGISQNSLTTWTTKGKTPRGASCLALANAMGVSWQWLASGEGPMELPQPSVIELPGYQADLHPILEAVNQVDGFCETFHLEISDRGKFSIAGLLVQIMGARHARSLQEIPLDVMGQWSQDVLRRVQSGEIK